MVVNKSSIMSLQAYFSESMFKVLVSKAKSDYWKKLTIWNVFMKCEELCLITFHSLFYTSFTITWFCIMYNSFILAFTVISHVMLSTFMYTNYIVLHNRCRYDLCLFCLNYFLSTKVFLHLRHGPIYVTSRIPL